MNFNTATRHTAGWLGQSTTHAPERIMTRPTTYSRRKNFNVANHAHELTFSCYQGLPFLRAERTCIWRLESIEKARTKLNVAVWAYVIMPEHVHLLICSREAVYDVARIRKAIKEPVRRQAIAFLVVCQL
jgi:REP element-mobilizing transposase RayT